MKLQGVPTDPFGKKLIISSNTNSALALLSTALSSKKMKRKNKSRFWGKEGKCRGWQMSSTWESKRRKRIRNYKIQISLILSFCLCKQKQHTKQKKLKIKLSLTKRRTKIIDTIEELVPEVKFTCANVNDNLKIRLEKGECKYTFSFNSINSLHNIFRKFGWSLSNNDISDD